MPTPGRESVPGHYGLEASRISTEGEVPVTDLHRCMVGRDRSVANWIETLNHLAPADRTGPSCHGQREPYSREVHHGRNKRADTRRLPCGLARNLEQSFARLLNCSNSTSLDECTMGRRPAPRTDRPWRWAFFRGIDSWSLSTGQDADEATAGFGAADPVMVEIGCFGSEQQAVETSQKRAAEQREKSRPPIRAGTRVGWKWCVPGRWVH